MPSAMTTMFGSAMPLQARREVRRLADDAALLRLARSDQVADHDQPGRDADTGLQRSAGLQRCHRRDQLQPRPHRPLGVVLMRLRIAEIHQHAVAHVLRHEPAEALHGLGDAFLIGRNDLAQVLRVHAGGERRRADQVREHHRDLAALGGVLEADAVDCRRCRRVARLAFASARSAAMASSSLRRCPRAPTPSSFRSSAVRLGRTVLVNLVLAECRLIPFEAKAPQPNPDVHVASPNSAGAHDRSGVLGRAKS